MRLPIQNISLRSLKLDTRLNSNHLASKCLNTRPMRRISQTVAATQNSVAIAEKIEIKGWIRSVRKLKELVFFDVSDGSSAGKLQVTIPVANKPETLNVGASVIVKGVLGKSPNGQPELKAEELKICGACPLNEGYPFLPRKQYSSEYVRQYLHLRPRTNKFAALLRIRSQATFAIHEYFASEGYVNIHTPILTSNDCEGAGEIFKVLPANTFTLSEMKKAGKSDDEAYFDQKAFLTVSGQLHLEACAPALSKVYCFGPTFRAENSRSRLHLSEFYMIEAETTFMDTMQELMGSIERLLKATTERIIATCVDDIEVAKENPVSYEWITKKFPVITYDEAKQILSRQTEVCKEQNGFTKEEEVSLIKYCGGLPTFVVNWPKNMKPFYMKTCEDDENKVSALDLLAPGIGEIVGGSLRENNYEKLRESLPNQSELNWYLELRKFGGVPTGGFGLGFERYLQWLLSVNNIKDTIPFPRWPHNCSL